MRQINSIILHCSATQEGQNFKASDIDKWHKQQGWNCIGYHYVIDLDGKIETGRPIEQIGAHCKGHNSYSIGICYIGGVDKKNKEKDTRTEAQKESMYKLVKELMSKYHIDITSVHTHNEYDNKKACPSFTIYQFRAEFSKWLAGEPKQEKKKIKCPFCGELIDEDLLKNI